jgi:diketogulonate reductase-like aldo/keto reductase
MLPGYSLKAGSRYSDRTVVSSPAIPRLGLGTWDLRGKDCVRAVHEALELGYRHVDTAQMYGNEREVGRGLKASRVPRDEVFLTTKLWTDSLTRRAVPKATEECLLRLATDYVDLLLVHWPVVDVPLSETLGAMTRLLESGKTRNVGVSNFTLPLWREALELAPAGVNQVEFHPYLDQGDLVSFAKERDLRIVAYTPLAKGRVTREPSIVEIAAVHGRTPAQVALRWLIQHPGVAVIPKASRLEHLRENLGIFDFELGPAEMRTLSSLGMNLRLVDPGWAPDWSAR